MGGTIMAVIDQATGYKVDGRVSIALDALGDEQKRFVKDVISDKENFIRSTSSRGAVRRLTGKQPLYVLRGPGDLRIIYSKTDDAITVKDLMQKHTLNYFRHTPYSKLSPGAKRRLMHRLRRRRKSK